MPDKNKTATNKLVANKHLINEKKPPPATVDFVRRWGSDEPNEKNLPKDIKLK